MARYEEIELSGDKLPILFSMKVVMEFCREKGLKLDDFMQNMESILNDPDSLELLVWIGFKTGHKLSKKELTIEKEMVLHIDVNTYAKYITMITEALIVNGGGNPQGAETAKANKGKKLKAVKA
jgi:hypothetical protein